jgi:hypothetical protein
MVAANRINSMTTQAIRFWQSTRASRRTSVQIQFRVIIDNIVSSET